MFESDNTVSQVPLVIVNSRLAEVRRTNRKKKTSFFCVIAMVANNKIKAGADLIENHFQWSRIALFK